MLVVVVEAEEAVVVVEVVEASMLLRLSLIVIVVLILTLSSNATKLSHTIKNEINLNTSPLLQSGTSSDVLVYCCDPPTYSHYTPMYWFQEIDIDIKLIDSPELPFYSVKGISSDDFHNLVQDFLMKVFKIDMSDSNKGDEKQIVDLFNPSTENILRDVLSACPSPLFAQNRDSCVMSFSPYGRACVGVATGKNINTAVKARLRYNPVLPILLAIGIFFLFSATLLSNSKIFQYVLGMVLFILLGTMMIIIQIYKFSSKRLFKHDSKLSWSVLTFLFSSYGGAVIWILRKNMKFLIITHWEFTLSYIVIFGLLGLGATRWMRSYDDTKHVLRVTVRWIIRILALILLYNSSASPLISITLILLFFVIYIIRTLLKFAGSSKEKNQ